jgi:hypothetical protein
MLRTPLVILSSLLLAAGAWLAAQDSPDSHDVPAAHASPETPPRGPFGFSMVSTKSGETADIEDFFPNRTCSICHKQQRTAMKGSMHSAAHHDPFYRRFAELAREEAGEEVYTYCSGCHSPSGVVSRLIPGTADQDLPREASDGVTCDACHQVTALTGAEGPWGEPGNASLLLAPGEHVKFGPIDDIASSPAHDGEARDFFTRSEYCASCHTIIHPINGLRIEHTFEEWKNSVYAENDIQCQDCHMRSVEEAIEVARTLTPAPKGMAPWARKGDPRPISLHAFVGANVEADTLAGSEQHAAWAEQRLKSAATLELEVKAAEGESVTFDVIVNNVGAGHCLPTSLTELREMWVHLRVTDAAGKALFESGTLDEVGDIREGAIRFGAHTVDAAGDITYKPWEAVGFAWKRLVPPRGSTRDEVRVPLAAGVTGPLTVHARLLFRISPPKVVEMVMGEEAFDPKSIERTTARIEVVVR